MPNWTKSHRDYKPILISTGLTCSAKSTTIRQTNKISNMSTCKVIHGRFRVKGYSPDGDSIRFEADNHTNWSWPGFKWKSDYGKKRKRKQIRIEAIDALETHYIGFSQPGAFSVAAMESLLEMLGIKNYVFNLAVNRIDEADDLTHGAIVTAGVDIFDRPICFVFPDGVEMEDGAEIEMSELPWKKSLNYRLLERGLVFPTFYNSLDEGILDEFRKATRRMLANSKGLWAVDRTRGFDLWDVKTVQERVVIMPKFFRRLIRFFEARTTFEELPDYLKQTREKVIDLKTGKTDRFTKLIEVEGRRIGLTVNPEDLQLIPG
ncbi:MAG: endonuclease YncB(thermonuclease family) [Verrucomicrobiales bacterium]|jgi:endonuclease YncB( thermonuclease family)